MSLIVTTVNWSDFARAAKKYRDRVEKGEKFLVLVGGKPHMLVRRVDPGESFTVYAEGAPF